MLATVIVWLVWRRSQRMKPPSALGPALGAPAGASIAIAFAKPDIPKRHSAKAFERLTWLQYWDRHDYRQRIRGDSPTERRGPRLRRSIRYHVHGIARANLGLDFSPIILDEDWWLKKAFSRARPLRRQGQPFPLQSVTGAVPEHLYCRSHLLRGPQPTPDTTPLRSWRGRAAVRAMEHGFGGPPLDAFANHFANHRSCCSVWGGVNGCDSAAARRMEE